MELLSNKLAIYRIDNFLSPEECQRLIEQGKQSLNPSKCYKDGVWYDDDDCRTSQTSFFDEDNDFIKQINLRIANASKQDLEHSETLQMQYYKEGEEFQKHYDTFHREDLKDRTQRTYTFMVYLNDVEEGGETHFPKLGLKVKPKQGRAVFWDNCLDGYRNRLTLHAGEPVIKGEKYIINKWFRAPGPLQKQKVTFNRPIDKKTIFMALFLDKPVVFLEEWINKLLNLTYNKELITVMIYSQEPVEIGKLDRYASVVCRVEDWDNAKMREDALQTFLGSQLDYYFTIDSTYHVEYDNLLEHLLQQESEFVSPMFTELGKFYYKSNFWGDMDDRGYYVKSENYYDLCKREEECVFGVPFVKGCYMIEREGVQKIIEQTEHVYSVDELEKGWFDWTFCNHVRRTDMTMFVCNWENYGYILSGETVKGKKHPSLFEVINNPKLWEARYLHPDYHKLDCEEPIQDLFQFPLFSDRFCDELIEEMEHFGEWSNGNKTDKRLQGGYENVPTRDIHFKQINFGEQWEHIIQTYIAPVADKYYSGYVTKGTNISFMVKYTPSGQPNLRPHHDASTYSLNVALNKRGIDFQGGGTYFLRQKYHHTTQPKGYGLIHPGRLTHYHEGVATTEGTRYIIVSFVE